MKVSVVIPCFNEEDVLPLSYRRFTQVMQSLSHDYELIFVNDGSIDRTEELLLEFAANDTHTKVLTFSRNFGHQNAVSAGLHHCTGDVAIIIDVDLQDPPEVIPQMIETYQRENCNVVYAVRNKREGETFMKKFTAKIYYRMLNLLSDYTFPVDTGDFRLIDRKELNAFKQFPEKPKYLRGLFSWMGFKQVPYHYDREERAAGKKKYSVRKMFSLASVGIFGFSKKPLKLAISLGTIAIIISLIFAIWVFIMHFSGKEAVVPGWASTIIAIVFLGGVQLFTIGILGEYIGNIFDETKNRPEYIIDKQINFDTSGNTQKPTDNHEEIS